MTVSKCQYSGVGAWNGASIILEGRGKSCAANWGMGCSMRMRDANARCECADYHPFWPSTKSKRPLPCADPSGDCGEGGDCHPQCQRKCSSLACNQVCGTICEQPRCSTRCQELGCSKLKCAIKRVSMSHRMHKSNTSLQVSL